MTATYKIKGMECKHCQQTVAKAISGVKGVEGVDIDLKSGIARVQGSHNPQEVAEAVYQAGFSMEPM